MDPTRCNGGGATAPPGLEQYVYRGLITLPKACSDWNFSYNLCCRNRDITTLNNPGGTGIYVESTLNNVAAPCNSSPIFYNPPAPFICTNQPYIFNTGTTDPDGDQLVHLLIPARNNNGSQVNYKNSFSGTSPIKSNPAPVLNSANGVFSVNPTQVQVGVLAVKVNEYRNGTLIGSVSRDVQIRVVACTNSNRVPNFRTPDSVKNAVQINTQRMEVCVGDSLTFQITATDPDQNQNLIMTDSLKPAGSFFTTFPTKGNPITGYFAWKPTVNDIGIHPVVFVAQDSSCPINGVQTYVINLVVTSGVAVVPDQTICSNGNTPGGLAATGGTSFTWAVISGDQNSLNCTNCVHQLVQPSQTTVYEVTSNLICNGRNKARVRITVVPPFGLDATPDTAYCGGYTI